MIRLLAASSLLFLAAAAPPSHDAPPSYDADAWQETKPRVVVFMRLDDVEAARALSSGLARAGFPVVDPVAARDGADAGRLERALEGSDDDALALERAAGAQVVVLGLVRSEASSVRAGPGLQAGTAAISVRALRLDARRVVSVAAASARGVDNAEHTARIEAARQAAIQLVRRTALVHDLEADWEANPWREPPARR
jgi:hypothetical protein